MLSRHSNRSPNPKPKPKGPFCTCCNFCNPPAPKVRTPEEIKASEKRSQEREDERNAESAYYRQDALKRVMDEAKFRSKHVTLC